VDNISVGIDGYIVDEPDPCVPSLDRGERKQLSTACRGLDVIEAISNVAAIKVQGLPGLSFHRADRTTGRQGDMRGLVEHAIAQTSVKDDPKHS
jgi:hypothetical protein